MNKKTSHDDILFFFKVTSLYLSLSLTDWLTRWTETEAQLHPQLIWGYRYRNIVSCRQHRRSWKLRVNWEKQCNNAKILVIFKFQINDIIFVNGFNWHISTTLESKYVRIKSFKSWYIICKYVRIKSRYVINM